MYPFPLRWFYTFSIHVLNMDCVTVSEKWREKHWKLYTTWLDQGDLACVKISWFMLPVILFQQTVDTHTWWEDLVLQGIGWLPQTEGAMWRKTVYCGKDYIVLSRLLEKFSPKNVSISSSNGLDLIYLFLLLKNQVAVSCSIFNDYLFKLLI